MIRKANGGLLRYFICEHMAVSITCISWCGDLFTFRQATVSFPMVQDQSISSWSVLRIDMIAKIIRMSLISPFILFLVQ